MAEEEKKVSEKNKNKNKSKDMNKNKEEKKKNNTNKVQKNVEKNKTNKEEKVQEKEPKKVKDEVKANIEKKEKAVTDNNVKKDEFEVKQTITAKKQNTGLKILGILVLLVIVCLAGLYIKYVVINKNTIGEVTRALMNTLSPKEKLYEALENTYKEKNIEQTFNAKITEFDSKVLGKNLVNVFGQKELEETIKGLELNGTAKRENSKTSMSAKLNYNEKSLIDAEIYQEIGKEGIAKFFDDEDLAVKLPKGVEVDTSKVEEYMNILRDLKKTYDSKYSDIIKYIDENIIKIEEKDGKIIVRTSFEQIKSSLKGLLLKIKEKPEFVIDTYKALEKIANKLEETGDYAYLGLTKDTIKTYVESIKSILQTTTTEGIKKDVDELVEDIKKLDNVNYNTKVEIEFTLKDKKISKVETKVEANNFLKVETSSELKYGNAKVESLKYNEGAISDQESTIKNITTKATMQLLSLPLAQKLMRNVQSGLGQ